MPKQDHIDGLDGLRGAAAIAVLFSHLVIHYAINLNHGVGTYGVFIFFVLSGFLMGHLYLGKPATADNVAKYLGARIARVVPLYYTIVIISWFVSQNIDPHFTFYLTDINLIRQLAFVGSKYVFWTIAPEFQFYILFSLFWILFATSSRSRSLYLAMFAAMAVAVVFTRTMWPGFLVLSKFHVFSAGILVCVLRQRVAESIDERVAVFLQIVATAFMVMLISPVLPDRLEKVVFPILQQGDKKLSGYYDDFGKLILMCFIVFAFSLRSGMASAMFGNRWAKAAGTYSFAIYLLHEPVIYIVRLYHGVIPQWSEVPLILLITWLVAAAVYRFYEEPALRHGRKIIAQLILRAVPRRAGVQPA